MVTHTGHVMNLANSIIGVSLLAMPFCFKQCGITLAIVMLIISSIISKMACHFLVKSSTMCRRRNFEFLAFYTFGPSGKLLVEIGVIGFMMGTCVAFFVVMGDLGPAIISKIFNIANNGTLRTSVLIGLSLLVVLPLGLLKNVESLAAISTVTIGFYFLFILKILFESSAHLFNGDWWNHVNFWQPEGVLQCIPIFAMALSCQTQLFEIYDSIHMPTIEKMNSIVHSAINICTVVYGSVGLLGYIAYCKGNFSGNILLSFTPSFSSELFKLGFVMSIAVSFPLVIFPCRASLFSLIFKRMPVHHELSQTSSHIPDSRFKGLTFGIVIVALVTGLLIPSIELVLGFVGSTIGIAVCVIFPSLAFLNLSNKNTNERLMAKITLCTGLVIMIFGTFGNLFAIVENKPLETPSAKFLNLKGLPQSKSSSSDSASPEAFKHHKKGIQGLPSFPSEKHELVELSIATKAKAEFSDKRRNEPFFPIAPISQNKEVLVRPQIRVVEFKKEDKNKNFSNLIETFSKPIIQSKNPLNEIINKDAIEKEEREILETEKEKKGAEEEKQQELLKKLRQHQDEQKKLLREQEKILKEIKHRENENKYKEIQKEKHSFSNSSLSKEKEKPFKPELNKNKFQEPELDENNVKIKKKSNDLNNNPKSSLDGNKKGSREQKKQKQTEIKKNVNSLGAEISNTKQEKLFVEKLEPLKKSPTTEIYSRNFSKSDPSKYLTKSKKEILVRDIKVEKKLPDIIPREKRDLEKNLNENLKSSAEGCSDEEKKQRNLMDKGKNERAELEAHDNGQKVPDAKEPVHEDQRPAAESPQHFKADFPAGPVIVQASKEGPDVLARPLFPEKHV